LGPTLDANYPHHISSFSDNNSQNIDSPCHRGSKRFIGHVFFAYILRYFCGLHSLHLLSHTFTDTQYTPIPASRLLSRFRPLIDTIDKKCFFSLDHPLFWSLPSVRWSHVSMLLAIEDEEKESQMKSSYLAFLFTSHGSRIAMVHKVRIFT
jgi:hypothetical protein